MPWEEKPPQWGQKKGSSPEDVIAAIIQKIKEAFEGSPRGEGGNGDGSGGGGKSAGRPLGGGRIFTVIGVIALLVLANSSYFTIKPGEQGVLLRFGKYVRTANPGLNLKIPLADRVIKVDVKSVRKEEFGFRTRQAGERSQFAKQGYKEESLMLAGDKNVIDVEWIVQYKAKDPVNFLFKIENVREAVRDLSETTIRRIVGNMDFDYVLSNREILAANMGRELQKTLDRYESGVNILKVQLQDVNPPDAVKPSFNEVNEADQDMKRLVNEAEETYNREIPKARGTAKRIQEEAHGYATQRVNEALGETARFESILKEYRQAKDVTRKRLYIETMQNVLPKVTDVYVIDKNQKSLLPLLNLRESSETGKSAK